jgi:uncharacterized protein YfaS (alpha-2-macroglobulin family)
MSSKLEIVRESLDDDDKPIEGRMGDEISVRIRVRALEGLVSNVAIVDLLPAGFEVVMQTAAQSESVEASSESAKERAGEGSSEGERAKDKARKQGEGEG